VSANGNVEILLVEDNPHDAELTIRGLKKHNFANKLHWVKDGVECLEFIRREGEYADRAAGEFPKLVLLDLKMPKLDGLDVLRELKGDERTRSIPIVVMTSSNQERDLVESYRLGVNGFVTKPVDFAQFMEAVANIGMYWLIVNQVPAGL
jgi:two-component system response regulator